MRVLLDVNAITVIFCWSSTDSADSIAGSHCISLPSPRGLLGVHPTSESTKTLTASQSHNTYLDGRPVTRFVGFVISWCLSQEKCSL